jgi:hypothetical protein
MPALPRRKPGERSGGILSGKTGSARFISENDVVCDVQARALAEKAGAASMSL